MTVALQIIIPVFKVRDFEDQNIILSINTDFTEMVLDILTYTAVSFTFFVQVIFDLQRKKYSSCVYEQSIFYP